MFVEKIKWYSPDEKLPKYVVHAMGSRFVPILIKYNGSIWPGLYEEGMFKLKDMDILFKEIELWAYYPKGERNG